MKHVIAIALIVGAAFFVSQPFSGGGSDNAGDGDGGGGGEEINLPGESVLNACYQRDRATKIGIVKGLIEKSAAGASDAEFIDYIAKESETRRDDDFNSWKKELATAISQEGPEQSKAAFETLLKKL